MALPNTQQEREYANFVDTTEGVARLVKLTGALGGLLEGVEYDYIEASYPSAAVEVYDYKLGGSGGTLEATVTVTYTDATKEFILSVART